MEYVIALVHAGVTLEQRREEKLSSCFRNAAHRHVCNIHHSQTDSEISSNTVEKKGHGFVLASYSTDESIHAIQSGPVNVRRRFTSSP